MIMVLVLVIQVEFHIVMQSGNNEKLLASIIDGGLVF